MDTRTESEKRAFAFDMAVKLHDVHGSNTTLIMAEADKIYEYVFGKKEEPVPAKVEKPEPAPVAKEEPVVAHETHAKSDLPMKEEPKGRFYGATGPKSKV